MLLDLNVPGPLQVALAEKHLGLPRRRSRALCTHSNWHWKAEGQKASRENGNQKKAGVAILISDKIDFKIKNVTKDKEGHYTMIKESIQEEDITIINIYAPNIGAPQYNKATANSYKRGNRQ